MLTYSPILGLSLKSRQEQLQELYQQLVDAGIFSQSYTHFLGSNWHRLLSEVVLPMLEDQQRSFIEAQSSLFSFWQQQGMAINGAMGCSYEGFHHLFSPFVTSLNLVTMQDDPRLTSAGQLSIYFDNLQITDEQQLADLFRKAMPIAIFTPLGDHFIDVAMQNSSAKRYHYFTLDPSNYTPLDLRIHVHYKQGAMEYSSNQIIESVEQEFNQVNRIGQSFYPSSYFNHSALPGLARMHIESALEGEVVFSNMLRLADFGQKFVLRHMEVVVD